MWYYCFTATAMSGEIVTEILCANITPIDMGPTDHCPIRFGSQVAMLGNIAMMTMLRQMIQTNGQAAL